MCMSRSNSVPGHMENVVNSGDRKWNIPGTLDEGQCSTSVDVAAKRYENAFVNGHDSHLTAYLSRVDRPWSVGASR